MKKKLHCLKMFRNLCITYMFVIDHKEKVSLIDTFLWSITNIFVTKVLCVRMFCA